MSSEAFRINLKQDADGVTRMLEETSILVNGAVGAVASVGDIVRMPTHGYSAGEATILSNDEQEDASITALILSIFAAVVWFYRQHTKEESPLTQVKKEVNPWYRRFKTAYGLGSSVGQGIAYFLPLEHLLPTFVSKILQNLLQGVFGAITGIFAGVFMPGNPSVQENTQRSIFKFGTDGWTKYAKVGLAMGSAVGAAIGAVLGTFIFPGLGTTAGIAIGGALGGVAGFSLISAAVPLFHKIRNYFSSPNEIKARQHKKPTYRTNYIRTGMSFGGFLGLCIGAVVGFCLPLPGASFACAAIGAGIGTLLGGIALGIAGPSITARVDPENKNVSSWDYGFRTGSEVIGSKYGVGMFAAGIFSLCNVGKNGDIKDAACGGFGFLVGIIGLVYDIYSGKKETEETKKPILPWSQRVSSLAVVGSFLGACIGFAFPPFGPLIGAGLGGIIFSAIAAKWGDKIFEGLSTLSLKLQRKIKEVCKEEVVVPDKEVMIAPSVALTASPVSPKTEENTPSKIMASLSAVTTEEERPKKIIEETLDKTDGGYSVSKKRKREEEIVPRKAQKTEFGQTAKARPEEDVSRNDVAEENHSGDNSSNSSVKTFQFTYKTNNFPFFSDEQENPPPGVVNNYGCLVPASS
jgi:hypothetical protein